MTTSVRASSWKPRGDGQICLHRRDTRLCDSVEALLYTAGDCFGGTSRSDGSELALCKIDDGWMSELGRFLEWSGSGVAEESVIGQDTCALTIATWSWC
jgi:hypothetical protein